MRIGNAISTAKRIDPSTKPMVGGGLKYAWAATLATDNTGTAWNSTSASNILGAAASNWDFTKNADGFRFQTASGASGGGGYVCFASGCFLKDVPDGATSNDPSVAGSTPAAGIPVANRYFGWVVTFASGSDYPINQTIKPQLWVGIGDDGNDGAEQVQYLNDNSNNNASKKVAYVNGLKVTNEDGNRIYSNRDEYTGLLTDGTASTEKGTPLTIVWDLNRDADWGDGDTTAAHKGRYFRQGAWSTDMSEDFDFTIHGYFWSNDDPTKMVFKSSELPISLTAATGKD